VPTDATQKVLPSPSRQFNVPERRCNTRRGLLPPSPLFSTNPTQHKKHDMKVAFLVLAPSLACRRRETHLYGCVSHLRRGEQIKGKRTWYASHFISFVSLLTYFQHAPPGPPLAFSTLTPSPPLLHQPNMPLPSSFTQPIPSALKHDDEEGYYPPRHPLLYSTR